MFDLALTCSYYANQQRVQAFLGGLENLFAFIVKARSEVGKEHLCVSLRHQHAQSGLQT